MPVELSIIIPTRNRPAVLKETLDHAIKATEHFPAEIIVVNDGEKISGGLLPGKILLFDNPGRGVSKARNFGTEQAKSDLLLFLDDDMWISKETIQSITLLRNELENGERVLCLNWEYPPSMQSDLKNKKIGRYILKANYHTMKGRIDRNLKWESPFEPIDGIGSGSFLLLKEDFLNIGGYNETIVFQGEDIDLTNRLKKNKFQILAYTPVTCFHNHSDRLDLKSFLSREYAGYVSQARAESQEIIQKSDFESHKVKYRFYKTLLPLERFFIFTINAIPNYPIFDCFSFRLIGMLATFQKIKASQS